MQLDTAKFKQRLETDRGQLQDELNGMQDENNQNVDTDNPSFGAGNHPADAASDVTSRERNMAVAADLQLDIDEIDHALERIADGTYGQCETCGRSIPEERLDARPSATFCIEHQRERERA
ncbi:MAG: TraR/DksA C4-type zinc finger protein [Herpetosiphonaceae bacterium]|nr:TraR/DksA C4-type zinc finger protein [Herpetosiphonaceae bacterium]